jgi:elongation factor P hydroxylase
MNSAEIVRVFNGLFNEIGNTELVGGAEEPLYKASSDGQTANEIWFRNDYASSALHEISHWCIAGRDRRMQNDYGYWYVENRGINQQKKFELVEARPQGLEWVLSVAAGVEFRVSCDNFELPSMDVEPLRSRIREEALSFIQQGLPARAKQFQAVLSRQSGVKDANSIHHYQDLPK